MTSFQLHTPKGNQTIGAGHPCFIIAEMSGNHLNGFTSDGFERAKRIIAAAAAAGADAIKLQTYTPDTITLNSRKACFMENNGDNPAAWQGKTMYELYQGAYTPFAWDEPLKKYAEELGLLFLSTPFDTTAVDLLETLGVLVYKVASYEATDHILLRRIAATGKPIIMSTGYTSQAEVDESVALLRSLGVRDLALLHCITYYTTDLDPRLGYLATMLDQRDRYDVVGGFSDNNDGVEMPTLAAALGASIIEKHIILDEDKAANSGYDAPFSLSATRFAEMVRSIRLVESTFGGLVHTPLSHEKRERLTELYPWADAAIGPVLYGPRTLQEKGNLRFRRSLFVAKDMKAGEVFTSVNVRSVRPSDGLETKFYFGDVLGKHASRDIEAATPLWWDMIA